MGSKGTLSDASTVIYLAKADALAQAYVLAGGLLVPPAVWGEAVNVTEGRRQLDQQRIRSARDAGWIRVVSLSPSTARRAGQIGQQRRIGPGESQLLALARKGSFVLMDDRRASRVARSMRVIPMRTIAIPVLGMRRGLIAPSEALELLRRLAGIIGERADVVMRLEADILEAHR